MTITVNGKTTEIEAGENAFGAFWGGSASSPPAWWRNETARSSNAERFAETLLNSWRRTTVELVRFVGGR